MTLICDLSESDYDQMMGPLDDYENIGNSARYYVYSEEELFAKADIQIDEVSKAAHTVSALFKDISFGLQMHYNTAFYGRQEYPFSVTLDNIDPPNETALCVILHGLKASYSQFDQFHEAILKDADLQTVRVYRPHIYKEGNCSIEEATAPILAAIRQWKSYKPLEPVFIVGASNGGRLAAHIASVLSEESLGPLKVSAVAAPIFGTKTAGISTADEGLSSSEAAWEKVVEVMTNVFFSGERSLKTLKYGSDRAKALIDEMRVAAKKGVEFDFYASITDYLVSPSTTAIPRNIQNSRAILFTAEGHNSIIQAAHKHQMAALKEFISKKPSSYREPI